MPIKFAVICAIVFYATLMLGCTPSFPRDGVRCAYAVEFSDLRARSRFLEDNAEAITHAVHARSAYLVARDSNDLIVFSSGPDCSLASSPWPPAADGFVSTRPTQLTEEMTDVYYSGNSEGVIDEKKVRSCAISIERGPPFSSSFATDMSYVGLRRLTMFGSGEAIFVATDDPCPLTKAMVDRVYKNTLGDISATDVRVCPQQSLEGCNIRANASVSTSRK